jgi:hypothetical protein
MWPEWAGDGGRLILFDFFDFFDSEIGNAANWPADRAGNARSEPQIVSPNIIW